MKKIRFIFLSGMLAFCLFAGYSSQSQKSTANITPTGSSVPEKMTEVTLSKADGAAPVTSNLKNTTRVKAPDASLKKVTDTSNDSQTPAPDVSQSAGVQNNNSGAAGGYGISDQTKDNTAVPKVDDELDFDQDGTISSADYKLSGMSRDDFASKLVSNGNVGTLSEAKQVIKGDITVMCGVFSGACN